MDTDQVSEILDDLMVATVGYQELIQDLTDEFELAMQAPVRLERNLRGRIGQIRNARMAAERVFEEPPFERVSRSLRGRQAERIFEEEPPFERVSRSLRGRQAERIFEEEPPFERVSRSLRARHTHGARVRRGEALRRLHEMLVRRTED